MAFMAKRRRRIFPGLIVCCFLMIYVIGATFTETPAVDYLFDREQVRTFLIFVTLGGGPVPTVFSDFIFKDAIDGSLWTLPVEFGWYIVIGFLLSTCQSAWKAAGHFSGSRPAQLWLCSARTSTTRFMASQRLSLLYLAWHSRQGLYCRPRG